MKSVITSARSSPRLDPLQDSILSEMPGAPLLPSSFCSLLLQSLPSTQPQLPKTRMNRVSPRSPHARKKLPPRSPPPPNLAPLMRHPNQFISFPRRSAGELTQGNGSAKQAQAGPSSQPCRLWRSCTTKQFSPMLLLPGSRSLSICLFFFSRTRQGQCRRGDGAKAGPPHGLHQIYQPWGSCHWSQRATTTT